MDIYAKVEYITRNKRIIIYGAGYVGKTLFLLLEKLGHKVDYIVDMNHEEIKAVEGVQCRIAVKSPYDLLYENKDEVAVLVGIGAEREVSSLLESFGFVKEESYFLASELKYEPVNYFDPILGYGRMYAETLAGEGKEQDSELYGFKCFGNPNAQNRIVILGGSTSDPTLYGIKSWPEILSELLRDKAYIYAGGVIGYNSSQELLKLIRDAVTLCPTLVISYSGINDATFLRKSVEYPLIHSYIRDTLDKVDFSSVGDMTVAYGCKSVLEVSEVFIQNERVMHSICKELQIDFVGFLQGNLVTLRETKYPFSEYERRVLKCDEMVISQFEEFYKEVEEKTPFSEWFFDLTKCFTRGRGLFIDRDHCNEKGNQIVAESIYEVIKTIIK